MIKMRKSQLIEILKNIEGDPEIYIASDSEGNAYRPFSDYFIGTKGEILDDGNGYDPISDANDPIVVLFPSD